MIKIYPMKEMTCKQLGGACDEIFKANTFDEIAKLSQAHAKEKFMKNDLKHIEAMNAMQEIMKSPDSMITWMKEKKALFDSL